MTDTRIVLTTAGSWEEAEHLARHLVEHRLAACVNVVPGVRSLYRWKDAVETATEWLLLVKTTAGALASVETAIRELHSYELPEFLVLMPEAGSARYLEWIGAGVR
jgi:periplasmic divalent cation tolerance protein